MIEVGAEVDAEFRPHLDAVRASMAAGFRFQHVPSRDHVLALYGYRVHCGVLDVYGAFAAEDALAARFRLADLERPQPPALWHQYGTVADVVAELLGLPAHGTPGAPAMARRAPDDLWVPPTRQASANHRWFAAAP